MNKNVPNILSTFRIIMVPLFAIVYFSEMDNARYYALVIYLIASFTDILDGYIARKYKLISKLGTVLDPLADKLLQLTAISSLALSGVIPLWIMIFLFFKETWLIISATIMYFRKEKAVIPANWFGKSATVLLSLGILLEILLPEQTISLVVLILAIVLKVIAFVSYVMHYFENIHETKPST